MYNKIVVWGAGKEYKDALKRNFLWNNEYTVVDKKRELCQIEPKDIGNGFIAVFSHLYFNEICEDIQKYGIDLQRVVPLEFWDMQVKRHKKYDYLLALKRQIENKKEIKVVSNWYEKKRIFH